MSIAAAPPQAARSRTDARAPRRDPREDPRFDPFEEPIGEYVPACTGLRMTADEFLALTPDPSLDRWLIDGVLWEKPMTTRNVPHSKAEARVAQKLANWLDEQVPPFGEIAAGESAVRLPGRETAVGVDAVIFDAETVAAQPPPPGLREGMHVWHGVPVLAVEILSPSDREEEWQAKLLSYLEAGVSQVWILSPGLRTVTVHRPRGKPAIYTGDDPVPGDPDLPGLAVKADSLFGG